MSENHLEEKILHLNGASIHYYVIGQFGNELIVFLHPAFSDHNCFKQQIDYFAEKYRIIFVDMIGHGRSRPQGNITIDQTSDHVAEIMTQEGYERAHIVGASLGSLIAQDVAVRYPEKVNSVTALGGYSIFGDNREIQKAQSGEMFKWVFLMIFSMKCFRRYTAKITVIKPEEQEAFYQSTAGFTLRSFPVMAGMQKVLRKEDKIFPRPLLILCGDHDLDLAQRAVQEWHQREPDSEFHMIENAGHCANMDNAADFNNTLMDFLSRN